MEEGGDKPAIWLIDNTLPGGRSINLQLVEEGASKWCLPDLEKMGTDNTLPGGRSINLQLVEEGASKWCLPDFEKMGTAAYKKEGFVESEEDSKGSKMTELDGLIEIQTALVNLMLESDLKTELMEKLVEAKKNLTMDFSKSSLVKVDDEKEERRIVDADIGIEEPELEGCAGEEKLDYHADGIQIQIHIRLQIHVQIHIH